MLLGRVGSGCSVYAVKSGKARRCRYVGGNGIRVENRVESGDAGGDIYILHNEPALSVVDLCQRGWT
jgi:hypothetical protein